MGETSPAENARHFPRLEKRYLILAEGKSADPHYGKTARGVVRYSPHPTVAILDSTRPGETQDGIPVVGAVTAALCFPPTRALVGVAPQGGRFPPAWRELIRSCLARGLDVENGLHEFLTDDPELVDLAARHHAELRDLRKPPDGLSVPTGENLQLDAQVVLTVGSDCAIGKMTVSLELDREAQKRGLRSVFVPTGQTGIAIAGWGISVDAVVSDFLAGAAERLVVEGADQRRQAAGRDPGVPASKDWDRRRRKIDLETYARRRCAWQPTWPREKGTVREEDSVRRLLRVRRARVLRAGRRERHLRDHRGHGRPRRPDDVLLHPE